MLQNTFIHGPGIGASTEAAIWKAGAKTWSAFLGHHAGGRLQGRRYDELAPVITKSARALERRDLAFFSERLAGGEHWRLYDDFGDRAAFVDIETTGLGAGAEITVVAMRAEGRTRTFVQGKDLDRFPAAVAPFPLIVTYNGACFDLPFLQRRFRAFRPCAHIDLRFALRRLGYSGGLKAIERQLGVRRPSHLKDVDGFQAVLWWEQYQRGSRSALDKLVEYAAADVEGLEPLVATTAAGMAEQLGFPRRGARRTAPRS